MELGAGLDHGPGGTRGLLTLAGAMHDERLGDQRRFGFPSHTALTVMQTQTAIAFDGPRRRPHLPAWQARLIGYRSLRPGSATASFPQRLLQGLGGELFADLGGRARAGRPTEARLGAGWILPLAASDSLGDHLLLTAGLVATLDRAARAAGPPATVWGLGPAVGLEGRLGLDRRQQGTWVAARSTLRPLLTSRGHARELLAAADLRLPVRDRVRLPFSSIAGGIGLRLTAALLTSTLLPALDRQLSLTIAVE
jgi:hypothetical protein